MEFRIPEDGENSHIGNLFLHFHIIFHVKMEKLCRKALLVSGGRMTDKPGTMTYTSIISHETVHLAIVIDALNDLEVKYGDVMNE